MRKFCLLVRRRSAVGMSQKSLASHRVVHLITMPNVALSGLFVLFIAIPPAVWAHTQPASSSAVAEHVTESSGAAVQGATVHIKNPGSGAERKISSNLAGLWVS